VNETTFLEPPKTGGEVTILPNPLMVLLQAIPFLVVILYLNHILFKPMLRYLEDRDNALEKTRSEAADLQSEIEKRTSNYEEQLKSARADGIELRAKRRAEALGAYDAKIKEARDAADAKIAGALSEISDAGEKARSELADQSRALAGQIAGHVLGRSPKAPTGEPAGAQ